jgi:RHH-type rel operon transcriptional repressor/antitoxin RelB
MLAIRLPADLEERLSVLAERTGRTKTFYAREAIEKHLDDLEDRYLAEQELAKVQSGRSKPLPLAAVMKAHGLDG